MTTPASPNPVPPASRRDFLTTTTTLAAASALGGLPLPWVHAAENNTIQVALIGCGGRGTGAAGNALETPGGPVRLVAMADLFEDRLTSSLQTLREKYQDRVQVPPDRRFVGFDAFKKAIDCLRPGDVAALCTHAAFRPTHLQYAIAKGVHVFMEKTFAPDPGGIRDILRLGEEADRKGLKIACGLMCRHSTARAALIDKIRAGELGDIHLIRAYRMDPGYNLGPFPGGQNELLWQIRRPYFFLWASSGIFIELMIHQIDECCWLKDAWPISAHGLGGRAPNSTDASENLDSYSIEFTFADGAKALVTGRYIPKCHNSFETFVHGTQRAAQFSGDIHAPTVQTYKDQRVANTNIAWRPPRETINPWQAEWNNLLDSIRHNKPHNEARRAAYSNLAAIMGRAAVHSGQIITWDDALASDFRFCPDVAALGPESPAPTQANPQGRYAPPIPGQTREI